MGKSIGSAEWVACDDPPICLELCLFYNVFLTTIGTFEIILLPELFCFPFLLCTLIPQVIHRVAIPQSGTVDGTRLLNISKPHCEPALPFFRIIDSSPCALPVASPPL